MCLIFLSVPIWWIIHFALRPAESTLSAYRSDDGINASLYTHGGRRYSDGRSKTIEIIITIHILHSESGYLIISVGRLQTRGKKTSDDWRALVHSLCRQMQPNKILQVVAFCVRNQNKWRRSVTRGFVLVPCICVQARKRKSLDRLRLRNRCDDFVESARSPNAMQMSFNCREQYSRKLILPKPVIVWADDRVQWRPFVAATMRRPFVLDRTAYYELRASMGFSTMPCRWTELILVRSANRKCFFYSFSL